MTSTLRRTIAATAVAGAALGLTALVAAPAGANPSDTRCTSADLDIRVYDDEAHPGQVFIVKYEAATPHTNCKLQGTPEATGFKSGATDIPGVTTRPDGAPAAPVNVTADHPAFSLFTQDPAAPANPAVPSSVTFDLPGVEGRGATGSWDTDQPLRGAVLTATPFADTVLC